MNSPASFRIVTYQVAGSVTYIGDLFITEHVIYFFPQAELAGLFYTVGYLGWGIFGILILLIAPLTLLAGLLKETSAELVKKVAVDPYTREGKLARQEAAKHQAWLYDIENSYPKPKIEGKLLWPLISHPALWYPLILDSLVAELKETQSISMESLPAPVRFTKDEIKGIRVTVMGKLIVETEFDMRHGFRVGFTKKGKARRALVEGKYAS